MIKQTLFGLAAVGLVSLSRVALADPPTVNGQSLTSTTTPNGPAERFGARGQMAISSDSALTISNTTTDGVSGSVTTVILSPAIDFFLLQNFSVGGFVQLNYVSSGGDDHSMALGAGPRVGYNFTLSDLISIWPKAGLSIQDINTTVSVPSMTMPGTSVSTSSSDVGVAVNLFIPIMFHPAPHFFAGFGPFLDAGLSGDTKATTFGGKLTLGGWVL